MKYGVRAAIDFATVNGALRFSPPLSGGGDRPTLRIFVGAVSPLPLELNETSEFLVSNFSRRSSLESEIEEQAQKEVSAKASLIRESGISLKSKKNSFEIASKIVRELLVFLAGR